MGRPASITYEQIEAHIQALLSEGKKISITNIQQRLTTTPSATTISNLIKEWRENCAEKSVNGWQEEMPDTLIGSLRTIWQEALSEAERTLSKREQELQRKLDEADELKHSFQIQQASSMEQIRYLTEEKEALATETKAIKHDLQHTKLKVEQGNRELAAQNERAQGLSDLLRQEQENSRELEKTYLGTCEKLDGQWKLRFEKEQQQHKLEEDRLLGQISELRTEAQNLEVSASNWKTKFVEASGELSLMARQLELEEKRRTELMQEHQSTVSGYVEKLRVQQADNEHLIKEITSLQVECEKLKVSTQEKTIALDKEQALLDMMSELKKTLDSSA